MNELTNLYVDFCCFFSLFNSIFEVLRGNLEQKKIEPTEKKTLTHFTRNKKQKNFPRYAFVSQRRKCLTSSETIQVVILP